MANREQQPQRIDRVDGKIDLDSSRVDQTFIRDRHIRDALIGVTVSFEPDDEPTTQDKLWVDQSASSRKDHTRRVSVDGVRMVSTDAYFHRGFKVPNVLGKKNLRLR